MRTWKKIVNWVYLRVPSEFETRGDEMTNVPLLPEIQLIIREYDTFQTPVQFASTRSWTPCKVFACVSFIAMNIICFLPISPLAGIIVFTLMGVVCISLFAHYRATGIRRC